MSERKNVVIKSAISERPFVYKQKPCISYEFRGQIEGEDAPVKFEMASKDLGGIITKEGIGGKIEVEYATIVKGDFTNRKVAQIYINGQPMKSQEGYRGKSYTPKDDNAIMLQVAFKGAIEAEGYWYVPDGKQHTDRVIENTDNLVAGLQEILKTRFSEAKKIEP